MHKLEQQLTNSNMQYKWLRGSKPCLPPTVPVTIPVELQLIQWYVMQHNKGMHCLKKQFRSANYTLSLTRDVSNTQWQCKKYNDWANNGSTSKYTV